MVLLAYFHFKLASYRWMAAMYMAIASSSDPQTHDSSGLRFQ